MALVCQWNGNYNTDHGRSGLGNITAVLRFPNYFTDEVSNLSEFLILINDMADGEGFFNLEEFKGQFYLSFKVIFFLLHNYKIK